MSAVVPEQPRGAVEIACPVQGLWSFMNPPGHHPDAKDFVAVDDGGKPYKPLDLARHLFWRLSVTKVFAWEKKVLAPFNGLIVEAMDDCDDRQTLNLVRDVIKALVLAPRHNPADVAFFLGNHLIMRSDQGIHALFAHLRKGSLCARVGQRVEAGEVIAAVGNSGNTIQPHFHFQLMQENAPFTSLPLPFFFSSYEVRDRGAWRQEQFSLPKNGEIFRAIEGA